MANTVNEAFNEFMASHINLPSSVNKQAKDDINDIYVQIENQKGDDFFVLYKDINMYFGSFARKTKCQPLNDVDVMLGLSAEGNTYSEYSWEDIIMYPSAISKAQQACKDENGYLNSNMLLGKVKSLLINLADLRSCDIKKNQEAIVFDIKKKDWSFDIIPCFYTKPQSDGRQYYLIPNGKGRWKKTDPRIDRAHMLDLDKQHNNNMLPAIRLFKWWNKYSKALTIDGYVMECLLAQYFENNSSSQFVDMNFINLLEYFAVNIYYPIPDPKNIQSDLNNLSHLERKNLSEKAANVYQKAKSAHNAEVTENDQEKAINIWRDIFGRDNFPSYSE